MACDGCTDVCTCVVQSGENITVTGSGSNVDPYIVNAAGVSETAFAATSSDGSIDITPAGTAGHTPDLTVDSCELYDTGTIEASGQLFVQSDDADCIPHRLVAPGAGQVLGEVGGEWGPVDVEFTQPAIGVSLVPYTASGSFEKADYPGMQGIWVEGVAAGGGGGGSPGSATGASATGGGGAGEYGKVFIPVADLGVSETVTVGVFGAGGAAGSNPGIAGTSTSFGAFLVLNGGGGGAVGVSTTGNNNSSGGVGGVGGSAGGIGGSIGFVARGGVGSRGQVIGGVNVISNDGGHSFYAAGAEPNPAGNDGTDANAKAYGVGGAGCAVFVSATARPGGDGAPGFIEVSIVY